MHIKEAKEQIKNAMTAYFTKNEFGDYVIPIERQRPVFLMGPPGIGKTAIMEQIAAELGVGLVSYSMTHHTRQSALGLPFIVTKTYGGTEYQVSEYTMSEIISSVYDTMEESGIKEGILFLDEINCVSETLAPAMLQFLQYKIFGRHTVPKGWIVVTAGNPPEYNNSVREFDIVTWDRLKRIDVEPDYEIWKEYAYKKGIHPSILTYLDIKRGDFYKIETTVDGKTFVTARGWSDLSDMMKLYEANKIVINEQLISQYLQNKKIAKEFAIYYDLFNKYRSDYQVDKILAGKAPAEIETRARDARFDERLALLGLLIDGVSLKVKEVCHTEDSQIKYMDALKNVRSDLVNPKTTGIIALDKQIDKYQKTLSAGKRANSISTEEINVYQQVILLLEGQKKNLLEKAPADNTAAFKLLKTDFDKRTKALKKLATETGKQLDNLFVFCENVFADGQEMLILVTELTANYHTAHYISRYGCPAYFRHNKELLFYERQKELISELELLEL